MKLLAATLIATIAFPLLSTAQTVESPPSLMVTGNAQILATPDEATVQLGIVRQATTAQLAQEQANAVAQEILNAITRAGALREQVQTSQLVLSPVYAPRNPDGREPPRIVAYSATNSIYVRLSALTLIGPVIDAALRAGANELHGVQFGLRNDLPTRQEALKLAAAEARSKAQVMADALSVNLDQVVEVSEGGISIIPRTEFPLNGRVAEAFATTQTPVSPGQLEVHATVTVRYRISPKR
jgi:uncharacterized protein YggE